MNDEETTPIVVPEVEIAPTVEAVEVATPTDPSFGKPTHFIGEHKAAKPERKGEDPDEVLSRISPYQVKK